MIAIIDYGAGNTQSVQNALMRCGVEGILTNDATVIQEATKVIFPGVGEASNAMSNLISMKLDQLIPTLTQPVLGICLGMQLMCTLSEEGNTPGLGIFDVEVKKFQVSSPTPHMGWNSLHTCSSTWTKQFENEDVYFVHNYYVPLTIHAVARCTYDVEFSAALQKDNFYGAQFHPEKSSSIGQKLLQNFLTL